MRAAGLFACLLLGPPVVLWAQDAVHAALSNSAACSACHAGEAQARWESSRSHPCTPFCLTCHEKAEMAKHHPVGGRVDKPPRLPLRLTRDRRSACFSCHDLGNHRYDTVRWKAESLFGRLFRPEKRHRTYFLAVRNDRGQLCLACH